MTVFKRRDQMLNQTQDVKPDDYLTEMAAEIALFQGVCLGAHMPTDMCTALYLGQVVTQRFSELGRSHQDRFKKE